MQLTDEQEKEFLHVGFVEIESLEELSAQYSAGCSGGRSDCCTRVCSQDQNFVSSTNDWERFLEVKGGQVQY
ncbi:hypothetical protein [Sulfurospirillum sp. UCH001]|uniref:hypothetical protein n=1 Tax=Sulfurospirillum sp. UCH001 TaxID=1581011 RepID=UPI00082956EB|nr:hypothetical protein [Sulfurospirillum sp. UCH001]